MKKKQRTDTTIIIYPNTGVHFLRKWNRKSNDKNFTGKIQNFTK